MEFIIPGFVKSTRYCVAGLVHPHPSAGGGGGVAVIQHTNMLGVYTFTVR